MRRPDPGGVPTEEAQGNTYPQGVVPRPPSRLAASRLRGPRARDRHRAEVLHGEGSPLRIGPWQGHPEVASLAPVHGGVPCAVGDVRRAVAELADRGYASVVTAALAPLDQAAFLTAGFHVHERLHLLARDLPPAPLAPVPTGTALRRAHPPDRPGVLAVDRLAFEPFWRLDEAGLQDAVHATPTARFRVAVGAGDPGRAVDAGSGPVLGYSVVGRASHRGYVQRLAVAPDHHRSGLGRALLADGLQWLERRRVRRVMVNTQERNLGALALYERTGFERQPGGLAVLALHLRDDARPLPGAPR